MANFDNTNGYTSESMFPDAVSVVDPALQSIESDIFDTKDALAVTIKFFLSSYAPSAASPQFDLQAVFFEHSDDTNPANFVSIPTDQLIGDPSEFIIDFPVDTLFAKTIGFFNNKRYVRMRFDVLNTVVTTSLQTNYYALLKKVTTVTP